MKVFLWDRLTEEERERILQRSAQSQNESVRSTVRYILEEVKRRGDDAVREFSQKFDHVQLRQLRVSDAEFARGIRCVSKNVQTALRHAARNIEKFHRAQQRPDIRVRPLNGIECRLLTRPIQKIGLYIPGGTAVLPSTLLMLGIPAKIAGCPEKMLCTPPRKNGSIEPTLLFAAKLCGIRNIYKVGGAQAIAAMAYGTHTIPKADKIFGPGNAYVTDAKLLVSQEPNGVAIDIPAGPSEVMILADRAANPAFIAADLLSQAEHDTHSQAILVTTDKTLAPRVQKELERQLGFLLRRSIAAASLENNGRLIVVKNLTQATEIVNRYAPEHLLIQTKNPESCLAKIHHAGSVFLGNWSPESVGDYASGTNHVLPTYGYAKIYSGVTLASFTKTMTVQKLTRQGLQKIAPTVQTLAEIEELHAHKNAVAIRLRATQK